MRQVHIVLKSEYWEGCDHVRVDSVFKDVDAAHTRRAEIWDERCYEPTEDNEFAPAWVLTQDVRK